MRKILQQRAWVIVTILLVLGYGFLLFYRLGNHPFIDWDESIYAQVARESLNGHNSLNFKYFGQPWYEKPPLGIWLTEASFFMFGVNEWSARLPIATAGFVTVVLTVWFVWKLSQSKTATVLSAGLFYITFPFLTASYFLNFDTLVGLFVLSSVITFWLAQKNFKFYYLFGLSLALGVLTKSVVGLLPLGAVIVYGLSYWDFKFFRSKHFWLSLGLAILLIAPWHIYETVAHGKAFWENYFYYHVLTRFREGIETNGNPWNYYIQRVFLYGITKILLGGGLVLALVYSIKEKVIRYPLINGIFIFALFSASATKLPAYIVVALPFLIMASAMGLGQGLKKIHTPWLVVLSVLVLTLALFWSGFNFNKYKLATGEYTNEYLDNKQVGLYLKNNFTELPVFINAPYKNLGIGFYSQRSLLPISGSITTLQQQGIKPTLSTPTQKVYVFSDRIIIFR